ncbi:MAG: hypothetical protein S4CHLAM102_07030 [Chlamydiia bacterium]|nr:hypothetical protein [Chlamydiia bacterium]
MHISQLSINHLTNPNDSVSDENQAILIDYMHEQFLFGFPYELRIAPEQFLNASNQEIHDQLHHIYHNLSQDEHARLNARFEQIHPIDPGLLGGLENVEINENWIGLAPGDHALLDLDFDAPPEGMDQVPLNEDLANRFNALMDGPIENNPMDMGNNNEIPIEEFAAEIQERLERLREGL